MLKIRENNACPRQTRHFMTKNTGAPFNCCVDFPKATEVKKFQKLKTNNAELCSKKVGFFMMQDFETMQVHCAVHACLVYSIVPQTVLNTLWNMHTVIVQVVKHDYTCIFPFLSSTVHVYCQNPCIRKNFKQATYCTRNNFQLHYIHWWVACF